MGAVPGSTVQLYDTDGTTLLGSAVSHGSGNYAITTTALGGGVHNLTVRTIDDAGNAGTSTPALTLAIDTTAPAAGSAPILASASNIGRSASDGITSVRTPTITDTVELGATERLYETDGTTMLGQVTADGSGGYAIASSPLGNGTDTLTIRATDAAGNTGTASTGLTVTIDATAPGTPSSAPVLSATPDSGTANDGTISVATPTIDGASAEPGSTFTLYESDGTHRAGLGPGRRIRELPDHGVDAYRGPAHADHRRHRRGGQRRTALRLAQPNDRRDAAASVLETHARRRLGHGHRRRRDHGGNHADDHQDRGGARRNRDALRHRRHDGPGSANNDGSGNY